ncbi:MAG TPA: dienelactone hydrolase family protein [Stellaceae bacterium]|nr:dienelactone hydrolase family protein [Stellaceae bacterium]
MDQRLVDLFNHYTHGGMSRRAFLDRFAALAGGGAAASALLPLIDYNYAKAETVAESDPRISAEMLEIAGVAGLKGYLVTPKSASPHGSVVVIHENRGLNPHIKDIARRIGIEGFEALAVDCLSPLGGMSDDSDQSAGLFQTLKPEDALADIRAAFAALKTRPGGNGKVGAVGFCWGGGQVNNLAVAEPELTAGVAFYGRQPSADKVPAIKAALLLHYAGLDQGIDAGIPAYEAALKQAGKTYEIFVYPNVNHGFNNDTSEARYNKEAADLAWSRTIGFFKKYLA